MKHLSRLAIALTSIAIGLFSLAGAATAEDGPSFNDTAAWIKGTLKNLIIEYDVTVQDSGQKSTFHVKKYVSAIEISNTSIRISTTDHSRWPGGGGLDITTLNQADIQDLKPTVLIKETSVTSNITIHFIVLECRENSCWHGTKKTLYSTGDAKTEETDRSGILIEIASPDMAERLSKSFHHLITLGGGVDAKKDVF